jgi:hypothetical protein
VCLWSGFEWFWVAPEAYGLVWSDSDVALSVWSGCEVVLRCFLSFWCCWLCLCFVFVFILDYYYTILFIPLIGIIMIYLLTLGGSAMRRC